MALAAVEKMMMTKPMGKILVVAVLSWHVVSTGNCEWRQPPSCEVQERRDAARCAEQRRRNKDAWCFRTRCFGVTVYCDSVLLGLRDDGSTTWRVETSTEAWDRDMAEAIKETGR